MGLRKHGRVYYLRFTDRSGREREVKGSTDRREAERMLAALNTREQKARLQLDTTGDDPRTPLTPIVAEFTSWIAARRTAKHAKIVHARISRILDAGLIVQIGDLSLRRVETALDRLRPSLSLQTVAHYTASIKSFSHWLLERGRVDHDPLARLRKPENPSSDRRRERRALTPPEVSRLLEATASGPTRARMTGAERVILYRLALGTGFRAGELATLRPVDFDLERKIVRLAGRSAKDRKNVEQPIGPKLAAELSVWFRGLPNSEPIFPGLTSKRTAEMVRDDLLSAGIDPKDSSGRIADFHALRSTAITWIAGVDPGMAVRIARHSDPRLTWGTYHDPDRARAHAAVEAAERMAG